MKVINILALTLSAFASPVGKYCGSNTFVGMKVGLNFELTPTTFGLSMIMNENALTYPSTVVYTLINNVFVVTDPTDLDKWLGGLLPGISSKDFVFVYVPLSETINGSVNFMGVKVNIILSQGLCSGDATTVVTYTTATVVLTTTSVTETTTTSLATLNTATETTTASLATLNTATETINTDPFTTFTVSSATIKHYGNHCQYLCDQVPACKNGSRGTYCKANGVCYALIKQLTGNVCYFPDDVNCSDDPKIGNSPVPCHTHVKHTCQELCKNNPFCDKSGAGSYCKSNGLCLGLYHSADGNVCYFPNQPGCNEVNPVKCY